MVNQQLVDYIKQQFQVGVSKDAVMQALKGAGWQDAEVADAMAAVSPSVAGVSSLVTGSAGGMAAGSPAGSVSSLGAQPGAMETQKSPSFGAASSPLSAFAVKPAVQPSVPSIKPIEQPAIQQKVSPFSAKPSSFSVDSLFSPKAGSTPAFQPSGAAFDASGTESGKKSSHGMTALVIILIVVIAGLLVAGGVLYKKNSDLAIQLSSSSGGGAAAADAQIKTLTGNVNDLTAKTASLIADNEDLKSQLAFLFSATAKAGDEVTLTLRGALATSSKGFILMTSQGVAITVKNSKDATVAAGLTPLAGTTISLTGTHVMGTNTMTVTAVNGKDFSAGTMPTAASTATTTAAATSSAGEAATSSAASPGQ